MPRHTTFATPNAVREAPSLLRQAIAIEFEHRGTFDFYNAGKFNGQGPDLIMFRLYRPDGSFGSAHLVEEQDAAKTRDAFIATGRVERAPP